MKLLSVLVIPALVTLSSQAETPEQLPEAAALVDGENSDLGEMKICLVRSLLPRIVLSNTAKRNPIALTFIIIRRTSLACRDRQGGIKNWILWLGSSSRR